MATRTIQSPGVEVREVDLSIQPPARVGTNVYVTGFADRGPTDEVVSVSSLQEYESIYGLPKTAAERYFYHSVAQLMLSPARVYVNRLPYGSSTGVGFGSYYGALVYPVVALVGNGHINSTNAITTNLDQVSATYFLGQPVHIDLTKEQYEQAREGSGFSWSSTALPTARLSSVGNMGGAGVIVLNKGATTINNQYNGYYVGISDNLNLNPSTDFDSFINVKTTTSTVTAGTSAYLTVPNTKFTFQLSASPSDTGTNSVSRTQENITSFNISTNSYDDVLTLGVYKLRPSVFSTDPFTMDAFLEEGYFGSIDYYRKQLNTTGGDQVSFFLETLDDSSRNIVTLVNPYISNKFSDSSLVDGTPRKKVRVLSRSLVNNITLSTYSPTRLFDGYANTGTHHARSLSAISYAADLINYSDNLYSLGSYSSVNFTQKDIGDLPGKLDRAFAGMSNDEIYDLDLTVEAGLGTIWAAATGTNICYYDDVSPDATYLLGVSALQTYKEYEALAGAIDVRSRYMTIFNRFNNFASPPYTGGGRGDHMFIADPIRHILVLGENSKQINAANKNFTTNIYWAMRHQFEQANTSYAAAYGNWGKVYDSASGNYVWIPCSSVCAANIARSTAATYPWEAPAGFNRGIITTLDDLAFTPNQKQRDDLYKININPITFFPAAGNVIYGQRTLLRAPSALDRINVRRLFLYLEAVSKSLAKYFVFEPNTEFTRLRFINALTPIFESAKLNNGLYDYLLVCDERNNTPTVIDNNELVLDVYLKPVRTAEFILLNFYAARTGVNLQEIVQ